MTIDEAIEKYKHVADDYVFVHDIDGCLEVVQLVEWLRQTRGADAAARWYTKKLRELEAENAKLREQGERLFDKTLELGTENAKLRELVRLLLWGIDNDMPRYEELAWSQKVNVLVRELGVDA